MAGIATDIRRLGGIAKASELLKAGHSPEAIRATVVAGGIIRIRKGWYANLEVAPDAVRAFRVGGSLDCVSAAEYHGLWVPDHSGLHLAVPRRASRLRTADDFRKRLAVHPDDQVFVHWMRRDPVGDRQAVTVLECIPQVFDCQGAEAGFVVLESALRNGRLDTIERHLLIDLLDAADRSVARLATADSASGTESMVKLRLTGLRIRFVQQALLAGAWPVVERAILAALSRGDHLAT